MCMRVSPLDPTLCHRSPVNYNYIITSRQTLLATAVYIRNRVYDVQCTGYVVHCTFTVLYNVLYTLYSVHRQ